MMGTPLSIRRKLTLWYATALGLSLLVFSTALIGFVCSSMISQVDTALKQDFLMIEKALEEDDDTERKEELDELSELNPVICFHLTAVSLTYASPRWHKESLDDSLKAHRNHKRWYWESSRDNRYRLRTATLLVRGETHKVTAARSFDSVYRTIRALLIAMAVTAPCTLILAMLGGSALAGRALAPIACMTNQARQITAENLSERLPVGKVDDELGRLAQVLNDMLRRLQTSFESLRQFTADASHELRTPLTALRSIGQVGLQQPLDAAAYRDLIGSMLEESDRLTHLVDSLLTLTRGESGHVQLTLEPTELGALVRDVAEWLSVLAEEKKQTFEVSVSDSLPVSVDQPTIRQALLNLLDNAIRYTPDGGRIQVRAFADERGNAVVEVQDNGSGIPKDQQSLIFERFYCLDKSRSREMGGTGLGLAIARWEVQANQGRIEVESTEGEGSIFRVILPLRKE
ncbi:MAG TPA: ATP-binding protein [bacterium]|nr:ATP-binding protein [bacterium]